MPDGRAAQKETAVPKGSHGFKITIQIAPNTFWICIKAVSLAGRGGLPGRW